MDLAEEFIHAERLGDVVPCPGSERFFPACRVILRAYNQDGDIGKPGIVMQKFAEFEAGQAGHHQVQRDQVRAEGICRLDGFCAVVDRRRLVTFHADQHFHQVRDKDIVVDNKDFEHDFILQVKIGNGTSASMVPPYLTFSSRELILDLNSSIWKGLTR